MGSVPESGDSGGVGCEMGADGLAAAVERLADADTMAEVQEVVRTTARRLVDAAGATFVLRDIDMCFYADEDAVSPLWKGQRFPMTECISGWAMLHAEPAIVPDITVDERIPQAAYRPTFVKSLAMVPIGDEKPVGAIGAYWARPHRASADEVSRLVALAAATAAAVERVGVDEVPFTHRSIVVPQP